MKRTFAQRSLTSLVSGFFLLGFLLLTASRAEAQVVDLGGSNNWMGVDAAKQELVSEVTTLYGTLGQPGSQGYNNKLAKIYYYRMIHRKINEGTAVGLAVSEALLLFTDDPSVPQTQPNSQFTDVTVDALLKQQLKSDATDLLTL